MVFSPRCIRDLIPSVTRSIAWVSTLTFGLLVAASPSHAATWTDLRGTHTIEADLIGIWGDQVILRKVDGSRIAVKLSALRSDSRIQAQELNEELLEHRSVRISELVGSAAAADAPAPDPLPTPPPAPEYQPPSPDMDPAAFLQHINEQAKAGHLRVFYDSLPPSYRTTLDELFALATSKIDAAQWQTMTEAFHGLGDLIVTRQNWIFSHPRFQQLPEPTQLRLQEVILATAGILRVGLEADAVSLEKMQSVPLGEWLAAQDQSLAPYLVQLNSDSAVPAQIVSEGIQDEMATITISDGPLSQKVTLTKVEGFWVPTALASQWEASMQQAKAALDAKANGAVLSGGVASLLVSSLQPMLAPLREADDATQFHLAMENLLQGAQPLVGMMGSIDTSGFRFGGGAAPGANGYGGSSDSSSSYGASSSSSSNPSPYPQSSSTPPSSSSGSSSSPPPSSSTPPASSSSQAPRSTDTRGAADRVTAEAAQRGTTGARP